MGAFDDIPDVKPAGAPVSGDNLDRGKIAAPPSVPISGDNLDRSKIPAGAFDDIPVGSEAQQSVARIRDIAGKMKAGAPYTPGPIDHIADAMTLSTSRPISAAAGAALGGLTNSYPGSSFGERYKAGVEFMNDRAAQAEKNTGPVAPIVGALAQLPATMALPGVRGAAAPASTIKAMGQSALAGGIEGAAQNAGSVGDAAKGAAANAAASAVTTGVLDKGMKMALPAARRGAAAEAAAARGSTPDELKSEAKTFFKQLDNNGIAFDAQQTAPLYTALHDLRNTSVYSPRANPTLEDHFNDLLSLTRQGATFNQLHDMRSAIAEQARGPDASTRRAAGAMLGEIDKLVGGAAPAVNPNGVNVKDAYGEAKRLWRAASIADDAGWIADKAGRKESWKSGVNPDEATRGNFARLEERVSKPGAYDPYTDKQRELLSNIVKGGKVQNMEAGAGSWLNKNSNVLGIGAAGAASTLGLTRGAEPTHTALSSLLIGAPVTMGARAGGRALENAAASRGTENVNALLRDITGSPKPAPGSAITRGDLAKILFAQDLERLAPRVGSQVIGTRRDQEQSR